MKALSNVFAKHSVEVSADLMKDRLHVCNCVHSLRRVQLSVLRRALQDCLSARV